MKRVSVMHAFYMDTYLNSSLVEIFTQSSIVIGQL